METSIRQRETKSQIYAEQVAHLYGHATLSYAFTVINGAILVLVEWPHIPATVLLIWFACLFLVTSGRGLLAYLFHRAKPGYVDARTWYLRFLVGVGAAGTVWGGAAVFLFPVGAIAQQVFLIMIIGGMIAGAVSVLAGRMSAFLTFALPTLLPLAGRLFVQGGTVMITLSAMTLLYLFGMILAARGLNSTILSSLILRFDNRELMQEIENREMAEEALLQEKERLQITLEALAEGVAILSQDGSVTYLNPAAEQLSGWASAEANGELMQTVFPRCNDQTRQPTETAVDACLRTATRSESHSLFVAPDGREKVIEEIATALKDRDGKVMGVVAVLRDVTHAREHSRQLAYQASHDALTQLPNRGLLWDRLNHAIEKATRSGNFVAVLFMDLDRFKTVNDSLGHAMGDALLKTVAERLHGSLREEDTVARLGGDEFVIVLEDLLQENQVAAAARKIIDTFTTPFVVQGHEMFVTASAGITLFPRDGETAELLLRNADIAMYRTKEQGRNNVQFYAEEMNARALERHEMEQQLRHAISRGELELHYQPRLDLKTGRIISFEALLRWRHPRNGLILPAEFIPIAEETGSILNIGEWVLKTACRQAREWHDGGFSDLRVAVNLSVCQIRQHHFSDLVASVLGDVNLEAEYLELEITESLFLRDIEDTFNILNTLKSQGVKLAIDDFGTGYSPLSYLKRFPVDVLKIDKSFIRDVAEEPGDAAIVSSIITMARGLKLAVIAEGVETESQLVFLRSRGCDGYQGYYYSRPLPPDQVTDLLLADYAVS